jgi:hypothetical protein
MTITLHVVLVIIALVCFALASIGVAHPRVNFTALGLFCWLLAVSFIP